MRNILLAGLVIGATFIIGAASLQAQSQATAGQAQGQGQIQVGGVGLAGASSNQNQGQSQSSSGGAVANSGNAAVSFNGSFNGSPGVRPLPIPQSAQYDTRGGPAFLGRPNHQSTGPNFVSLKNLVGVLNHIDLNAIEANDAGDIEMVAQVLAILTDDELLDADADSLDDEKRRPRFLLNKEIDVMETAGENFKPLAVVTLKADDDDTINTASLAVKLALYAKEINANRIVLIEEGVTKRLKSSGWGIGFAGNYASVGSDGNDIGSTGASGTGYSSGSAEYVSLPYFTAILGRQK